MEESLAQEFLFGGVISGFSNRLRCFGGGLIREREAAAGVFDEIEMVASDKVGEVRNGRAFHKKVAAAALQPKVAELSVI